MKRACIASVLIATAAAGCGGGSHPSQTSSTTGAAGTTSTSATAGGSASGASASDCNAAGINPTGMREGTCTHAGITWVIVDENHTLKLSTLWAQLADVRTSRTLISGGASTPASGDFVIASVTVTNRLPSAQAFDPAKTQQAGLILGGAVFKEDAGVENGTDPSSCLRHNGAPIQPGKSVTCDVVFDVAASAVAELGKHGGGDLYMVNFGSDLSGSVFPQTIGQIRLYH